MWLSGGFLERKQAIGQYCLEWYKQREIWLVDSGQVFDPYSLSRRFPAKTRAMMRKLKICRPFTFYQLRDTILSLHTRPIHSQSTIIISSIDGFDDEVPTEELYWQRKLMRSALLRLRDRYGCEVIIGSHGKNR